MKRRIRISSSALLGLLSGLVLACSEGSEPSSALGRPAPGFDLERLDGSRVRLAELRGKTVLIDFWASWCPPCVLEIPELNALYAAHPRDAFEIVAISLDDGPRDEIAAWVLEHDIHYPVALGDFDLARKFGAEQFPYHVLIDADGRVVERLPPGFHDREEFEALLDRHRQG